MKNSTIQVSVSVLATQLTNISNMLQQLDPSIINYIHIDVMDGHFVPAITFGEIFTKEVQQITTIPLDVHLMVDQPEKEVIKYFPIQPQIITFHYEATYFPIRLVQSIQEQGILAGIAINPSTTVQSIEEVLEYVDVVLVMSVEPGYAGQKFLQNSLHKVKELDAFRKRKTQTYNASSANFQIQVDGGINNVIAKNLASVGADIVVSGSYIYQKGKDPNRQTLSIKENITTQFRL